MGLGGGEGAGGFATRRRKRVRIWGDRNVCHKHDGGISNGDLVHPMSVKSNSV